VPAARVGAEAGEAGTDAEARAVAAGLSQDFVQQRVAAGWAYIGETSAFYMESYCFEAPTYGDSTASGNPTTEYQVIAHSGNQFVFWTSDPASGYSVDNLSPSAPLMLAGARSNGDVDLHWKPGASRYEDLKHYAVYRGSTAGFAPDPSNFVGNTVDTMLVDTDPGPSAHYYRVTAIDIHDNESDASNELEITGGATGTRTPSLPTVFTMLPNHPNPFARATTLRFGLPASSDVAIEVYDVAGRRVFTDHVARGAGWHSYQFSSGRLPSGVYFYRLTAEGQTETRKMVITR